MNTNNLLSPIFRLPNFGLLTSVSGLPTSDSRLPSSISRLRTSDFRPNGVLLVLLCLLLQLLSINTSQSQSLNDYLQIAAENNPEVKSYFNEYLAAMEKIPQVGALPDPELTIGIFLKPMDRFMGKQQADIQLMQMFPWFGMPGARKDEASKMALAKYQVFEDVKNQLFFKVKNIWYEMYRLEKEIHITKENIEILKTYERLALIRFQSAGTSAGQGNMQNSKGEGGSSGTSSGSSMGGMGGGNAGQTSGTVNAQSTYSTAASGAGMGVSGSGMSDVLRIRIQLKELENNLEYLIDSRLILRAEFNQFLNRNIDEPVAIADTLVATELPVDRLVLLDSITANNPMLKMLDAEEGAYKVQERMAKLEGRPMLGAGLSYMPFAPREDDGMSMGGKDMVMPMVSITLPIYRKKYNAMAKEAALNQLVVQQRRESTVNQLAVQWSSALRDLDDAIRKAALYEEQAGLANQSLNLLMTSYATDGQGFEEVLEVQQQLLDYQLKLVTAIVGQHKSMAVLEMLAATELD